MLIIEFGESVMDAQNKLVFEDYADVVSIRRRLLFNDVKDETTVFTGKGIHGFAALLYGVLCDANFVIAIDAPTFLDQENRCMYGDTRVFEHHFLREHQDVLAHIEPMCDTRIIMNVPTTDMQHIHTERVRLMSKTCIVTNDWKDALNTPNVSQEVVPATATIAVLSKPFGCGNFNNYYHWWMDHIISIVECCHTRNITHIKLCNKDPLVASFSPRTFRMFGIDASMTHDAHTVVVKGMNPKFVPWDTSIVEKIRAALSKIKEREPDALVTSDVIFIKRKSAKRCIRNEDALIEKLQQEFGQRLTCVSPEQMDVFEQMVAFSNAKIVIGQFGSGLTNVMFMSRGTLCIEIDKCYRKRYDVVCNIFGITHALYVHHKGNLVTLKQKIEAEKTYIDVDDCIAFIKRTVSP